MKGEIKLGSTPPKIRFREPQIEMAHGAGGKASRRLVEGLFAPLLFGASTEPLADAAHLKINGARMADHNRQLCREATRVSRRLNRRARD